MLAVEMTPEEVVPAYAGVILIPRSKTADSIRGSRIRGGDPVWVAECEEEYEWFPHTRG